MQVLCGKCGRGVDVGDAAAGAAVVCPHCKADLIVPSMDSGDTLAGVDGDEMGFAELSKRELSGMIEVGCSKCRRIFIVPTEFVGRRAKCPSCGHVVTVPVLDSSAREDDDSSIFSEEIRFAGARPGPSAPLPATSAPPLLDEAPPPLVADEPPLAVDVLSAMSAPRENGTRRGRHVNSGQLVKFGAIAGMLIVGVVAVVLVRNIMDKRSGAQPEEDVTRWVENDLPDQSPVEYPQEPPTPPSQPTPPPTNGAVAIAEVDDRMQVDVFAGVGYGPARPGKEFWKCDVTISVGKYDFVLGDEPGQIVLSAGDIYGKLVAIRPSGNSLRIDALKVVIPAKTKRDITLVFEMPAGLTASVSIARLTITDVGAYNISVSKVPLPAVAAVFGTFVEMTPRNLKPVLADPIMAAIQNSPQQQIRITEGANEGDLTVSLPAAGITGTGELADKGSYTLELTDGQHSLTCRLRVLTGGRVMLYLADEPFHQITFGNGSSAPSAASAAPVAGIIELVETSATSDVSPPPATRPIVQTSPEEPGGSFFDP